MVVTDKLDSVVESISNAYPFIDQDKIIELKEMAIKETRYEAQFGNCDFDLTFRKMFVKLTRKYVQELLKSGDYTTVSNIISCIINSCIVEKSGSDSSLVSLNRCTSELSLLCGELTEQQYSIIFTDINFTDLLDSVLVDNISIIRSVGIDSVKGNDLTKLILKRYYDISYCDNDLTSNTSHIDKDKKNNSKRRKKKMSRHDKTLRVFLKQKGYSDDQISDVFLRIPNSYREFITNKFGSDWDKPIYRPWESPSESNYYYTTILKNIMKMMDDPSFVPRPKKEAVFGSHLGEKKQKENIISEQSAIIQEKVQKQDFFEMLNLTSFNDFLLRDCSFECICLAALRYGGIDGVPRTTSEIARFLNLSGGVIGNRLKDVISKYKILVDSELDAFSSEIHNSIAVKTEETAQLTDLQGYLRTTTLKQAVFVGLSMGYVNGTEIGNDSISNFFGISEKEVQTTVRQSLIGYKDFVSQFINNKVLSIGSINRSPNKNV